MTTTTTRKKADADLATRKANPKTVQVAVLAELQALQADRERDKKMVADLQPFFFGFYCRGEACLALTDFYLKTTILLGQRPTVNSSSLLPF
jgi:hypothetical protein